MVGFLGYEYYQLQPKNHFNTVPVVSSGKKADTKQTNEKVEIKEPVFNLLLIGSDERKGQNIGHSDSMMLVHVDLNRHKYNAISIPRDMRVHLDGYGYTKLTSVQYIMQATKGAQKGVEAAVTAVSELTGVPINYYVETNYSGFQAMVDAVGSIEMNVPFDVKLTHPWYAENKDKVISTGTHTFDGKMVTEVVHERYSLANGEFGRQRLQEEALKGIAKKALSPSNVTKLPSLIKSIDDFVIATNMSTSDMLSLGLTAKNFNPDKQFTYQQLPGTGQKLYDDILKAKNSQLVLDQQRMSEIISANF
ncbi:LCP family protein [Bacillus sp. MM2020_4]|uniref:LCP family protein n=1 Tax=Bacillaceae TaxID=186817 RepID=UPI00325A43B8